VRRRPAAALVAMLLAVTAVVAPSRAAAPTPPWKANRGQLDKTIAYMRGAQNADGGWGGAKGAASDPLFTAWVIIGLAAAGINPKDQHVLGGTDAYTYVTAHPDALTETTDFERAMLVSIAAGTSPRSFGGRDLVAALLRRRLPDGSFAHAAGGTTGGINDTAFAMLPLSATDEPQAPDVIAQGAAWLVGVQSPDGGWAYAPGASESSDITAAVIQALRVAPRTDRREDAQRRGWAYLKSSQHADGGFGQSPKDPDSNSASTAWVLQAMWAAGIDPTTWRTTAGSTPLDYLASLQRPDGSIAYTSDKSMNDLWMTAYSAPALAGYPLPVPDVARTDGKGGKGAGLYSRAQADSTGNASGGVREISSSSEETRTQRRTGARKTATGTAQSNGVASSGVTPVASSTKDPKKTGGATDPRPEPATTSAPASSPSAATEDVTGRLLASAAPAGVSGTGTRPAAAQGLRADRPEPASDSATTALVLVALLALAALGGATLESRHGRKDLLP